MSRRGGQALSWWAGVVGRRWWEEWGQRRTGLRHQVVVLLDLGLELVVNLEVHPFLKESVDHLHSSIIR